MQLFLKTAFASVIALGLVTGLSSVAGAQQKKPTAPAAAQAPAGSPPQAQGERKPIFVKLAVLDVDRIRAEALALKDLRAQIDKYRNVYKTEIQKDEDELRKANEELVRKRQVLAPEAFEEERRKFEQRVNDVQRKVQQRRVALEKAARTTEGTVQKSLNEIVTQVANENELTLILRNNDIVFVATDLDITSVVLQRLDKKMPSVKVPDPGTMK